MATTTVRDWYSGKNIFITGGTGFVGVCLLEKLLRTIPDLGTVYLLMRPKRGKEISERLDELKQNLIFEKLFESKNKDEVSFLLIFFCQFVMSGLNSFLTLYFCSTVKTFHR